MANSLHENIDDLHVVFAHHLRSEYGVPVGLTLCLAKVETNCGETLAAEFNYFNYREKGELYTFLAPVWCYNALGVLLTRGDPYEPMYRKFQNDGKLNEYIRNVVLEYTQSKDKVSEAMVFYKKENLSQFDNK